MTWARAAGARKRATAPAATIPHLAYFTMVPPRRDAICLLLRLYVGQTGDKRRGPAHDSDSPGGEPVARVLFRGDPRPPRQLDESSRLIEGAGGLGEAA